MAAVLLWRCTVAKEYSAIVLKLQPPFFTQRGPG
jgi:hypothetical protein